MTTNLTARGTIACLLLLATVTAVVPSAEAHTQCDAAERVRSVATLTGTVGDEAPVDVYRDVDASDGEGYLVRSHVAGTAVAFGSSNVIHLEVWDGDCSELHCSTDGTAGQAFGTQACLGSQLPAGDHVIMVHWSQDQPSDWGSYTLQMLTGTEQAPQHP